MDNVKVATTMSTSHAHTTTRSSNTGTTSTHGSLAVNLTQAADSSDDNLGASMTAISFHAGGTKRRKIEVQQNVENASKK